MRCYSIIGLTGSGKSTLAKVLHEHTSMPVISSGDIARELATGNPHIEADLNRGQFAPELAVRNGVYQSILMASGLVQFGRATRSFVLEGFPQTVAQLIQLKLWSKEIGFDVEYIYMDVYPAECIERLVKRRRNGDNADSIAQKIKRFEDHTEDVLELVFPLGYTCPAVTSLGDVAQWGIDLVDRLEKTDA